MLSKNELERYSRQILLIGREKQLQIRESRILVLGAGGIGSALLPYLAASGVGYIRLIDPDVVENSNLSRQTMFNGENVGALKGPTACEYLMALNPELNIEWNPGPFSRYNHEPYLDNVDLILEGTDDIKSKFLVSDISVGKKIPAIIGSIGNLQGHVFPLKARSDAPCYRCLFDEPEDPSQIPTCATEGILSPLPGIIGSLMAYITLNFLISKEMDSKIYLMEKGGWRTLPFQKNNHCTCNPENESKI